jgi:hypothetical protein
MSMFPDRPPVPSPPETLKISAEERRRRHEDRLKTIRLRMAIGQKLDARHHDASRDRRGARHAGSRSDQPANPAPVA